jgi:hypothetical protein
MNSTLDILQRTPIASDLAALDADLAQRAQTALGYSPMAAQSSNLVAGNRLQLALKKLDIQPFDPKTVARYKAAVRRTPRWWAITLGVPLWIVWVRFLWHPLLAWNAVVSVQNPLPVMLLVALLGIAAAGSAVWIFNLAMGGYGQWFEEPLGDTNQIVPSFALQTALRIREADPRASFSVEFYLPEKELTRRRREARIAYLARDPFLVVKSGNYTAYVEVWDEPAFEQARKR